jgi:hypothetical protein
MAKKILMFSLILASFAASAPAAVVYGRGYGYARPGVRVGVGVYAAPRYYYGPRVYAAPVVPYVAPAYPLYPAYGYGYGYRGYAPRYYGGGYYRGGYARGYRR